MAVLAVVVSLEGARMKKPEPISKHVVCSACGMPWDKHADKPTLETCVELLKAALVAARKQNPYVTSGTNVSSPRFWIQ